MTMWYVTVGYSLTCCCCVSRPARGTVGYSRFYYLLNYNNNINCNLSFCHVVKFLQTTFD
uniref:Uncharacterized protein n=1 Tax=Daphnia galeata TaxID=27404 RepID=A0A8J2RPN0_9CRUS|nr:unnamed protein product [Daphnia galeata]